ncbi:c-type cytochrome biogenesis protein CcsB [candidate division KSB1 bacterium]|nr:c-type cytochrome biogenesis protein CcsB [candidate division KSB1 bacterium]
MVSLDVTFFWIAFWFYFASFIVFSFYLGIRKDAVVKVAMGLLLVGFIPLTLGIIVRWMLAGRMPLANMYEFALLMAWMAVFSFVIIVLKYKKPIVGTFVAPLVFVLMVSASLLPKQIEQQLVPALQSYWLTIHVSMAALGEGAFAVACGVSIMYLIMPLIRNRRGAMSNPASTVGSLPSLEVLDAISYRAICLGYPLFTIGALFAGAIWAYNAWGSFWGWDPKEVGSLIIWLFYTGYLHARYQKKWQGNRAAIMSIIGFIMVLLSFFGNIFLGGEHSYG